MPPGDEEAYPSPCRSHPSRRGPVQPVCHPDRSPPQSEQEDNAPVRTGLRGPLPRVQGRLNPHLAGLERYFRPASKTAINRLDKNVTRATPSISRHALDRPGSTCRYPGLEFDPLKARVSVQDWSSFLQPSFGGNERFVESVNLCVDLGGIHDRLRDL